MRLFRKRKKIDTIQYWKNQVEYLFSDEFEKTFQLLLNTKHILLKDSPAKEFKNHLTAAYIELLNITFAKNNVNRNIRYEIIRLQDDYIKSKNNENIYSLVDEYNKSFGSSFSDGIRPMANFFALSIQSNDENELENFIYELFYDVLNEYFNKIKNVKLI